MRAGGMSVWQFLRPGLFVAFAVGVLTVDRLQSPGGRRPHRGRGPVCRSFRQGNQSVATSSGSSWLRQNGADGESVMSAQLATNRGLTLHAVAVFIFDNEGHFVERVDGKRADLHKGYWEIRMRGSRASAASPKNSISTSCPHTLHRIA